MSGKAQMRFTSAVVMVVLTMMAVELQAKNLTEIKECRQTNFNIVDCLDYVMGLVVSPTVDCCRAVNVTAQQHRNKKCICTFIAVEDEGNKTLVCLPSACSLHGINPCTCLNTTLSTATTFTEIAGGYKPKRTLPIEALLVLAIMDFLL